MKFRKKILCSAIALSVGTSAGKTQAFYALHLEGTVSAVPVPAAAWLFGSDIMGLAGIARCSRG